MKKMKNKKGLKNMFKFLSAIFSNEKKINNDNKPKIEGKRSLIEELNSFLVCMEVENFRLINEEMYNRLKNSIDQLIEDCRRGYIDRQQIIFNYVNLYGEYSAYKFTSDFKRKSVEVRKNIIEDECKKVINKSKNGSSLEELLRRLEEIVEKERLTQNIKANEELLEMIKRTSYLLHKNFYFTNRDSDKSLSDEELLKFKNYIILDGNNLLNDSLKVQEIFALKDLNNPSILRKLYEELIKQESKENSEETKIKLTLFPNQTKVDSESKENSEETKIKLTLFPNQTKVDSESKENSEETKIKLTLFPNKQK